MELATKTTVIEKLRCQNAAAQNPLRNVAFENLAEGSTI